MSKTDHKPLVPLMSKQVNKVGSSVLSKPRLKLFKYKLRVEYLPGKKMHIADMLSRSYLNVTTSDDTGYTEIVHSLVKHLPMSEERKKQFIHETEKDPILNKILSHRSKAIVSQYSYFTSAEIDAMLSLALDHVPDSRASSRILTNYFDNLTDEQLHTWTGLHGTNLTLYAVTYPEVQQKVV